MTSPVTITITITITVKITITITTMVGHQPLNVSYHYHNA